VTTSEDRFELPDGRTIGFADLGADGDLPVLWCHGGPGSRLEPEAMAPAARDAGLRMIGIDRPGYGHSTPRPGRSIADWVPDGLAVADHLGIERFVAVGVSTGGAYALALAANAPERVLGVVACCALTDMRWAEGKAMMSGNGTADIWAAADRDAAMKLAADLFGEDGSKMLSPDGDSAPMAPADLALLSDPAWLAGMASAFPAMFAQGVVGYTDDRLADGPGWESFDVNAVRCPVDVIHGGADTIVPVAHAHHTASIIPDARLTVSDDLGHLSIISEVVPAIERLRHRVAG
jgi:pimeloyl-ACP methyl ester carboxylesterase